MYRIADCSNYEFYHWFYLALGSLYRIQDISGQVYFTIPLNNLEFQSSSLKLLSHTYIYTENADSYANLDHIHLDKNNCPIEKEIYKFLRLNFHDKNVFENIKPMSRLIYISREKNKSYNTKIRQILNEESIIPSLIELGFEIIYLEDLIFDEKVKVFMEAKMIITPIGGALSLGIFLNKEAKVIMINPPGVYNMQHFKDIYIELDLSFRDYTNIDAVDKDKNVINHKDDFANMIIRDIPDFIEFIKEYNLE